MPDSIPEKIKRPILVPVAFAIVVFLVSSLLLISWLQQRQVRESARSYIQSTRILYEGILRQESRLIETLLDFYKNDPRLIELFARRDRQALFAYASPIFEEIKQKYGITHFYFIDPERRCFLRMYNPSRHGDQIERYTLLQAMKSGEPHSGVELGASGLLSLRVDYPWVVDGKLLGYLEFGKEIGGFMPSLGNILGVEVIVLVEKELLDRRKWEEGSRLVGRQGDWDQLPRHVVSGSTTSGAPRELVDILPADGGANDEGVERLFDVVYEERHYRAGIAPLFVASGKEIGLMVVMKDFSVAEHSMQMLTGLLVSLVVVMGGFVIVFIYGVIGRVELRLQRSRDALQHEIQERRRAEKQILNALNDKQVLLKEIHHRVKNNMQIVCSIFRLQLGKIKDPQAAGILRDSQNRISAMALIHKTLYQPKDQSSIYFEEYIKELASSIFDSYEVDHERISLRTDLESVAMDIDTVTPCGLILNELITNSIKYAFPDGRKGEIAITFKKNDDDYLLSVWDNGIGLPAGMDIRDLNSLGLQLVVNLAEKQLWGRLEVESDSGGTCFKIFFRKQPGKSKV